ncbi:MAG: phosphoribosylamine--glycine ligase [Armatimonadota bacterium]
MRVLVVGGGGREHALCWAIARSATVYCTPGNPGTAEIGTNIPAKPTDHAAILDAVQQHGIDLTVIGPEAPLAAGLVDDLTEAGHRAFGPTAAAARIEASKAYAKEVMQAADVPTAGSRTFDTESAALDYIAGHSEPLVVKASGLAAGKGAIVCHTREEAGTAAKEMFGGKFGDAGKLVVVEEFLTGEELSVLAVTDGEQVLLLPASQDHKRIGEGDTGPNTGGMGAYTPVSTATEALLQRVEHEILLPVLAQMADAGTPYRGVLYAGLMVGDDGSPAALEFNCRFGDPETQVVLPAADVDITDHMWRIAAGERWEPGESICPAQRAAVTTVLSAKGYPGTPVKGDEIRLPGEPPQHTVLFHAGTVADDSGTLRTAGGRILCATGLGRDVPEAAALSRRLAEQIAFEGRYYRRDIAWREVARAGAP